MTTLREAAQQALEALEIMYDEEPMEFTATISNAITALRAALAQEPTPPPEARTEAEKTAYAAGWWDALEKARKAKPVQEPVQCEPQYANEDGWCEWVCPKPVGYLMQCCDCGLIHEVESRVAKYEPRPSEMFEVVDDPDLQAQWRMKRRDDISPKQAPQRKPLTDQEIDRITDQQWTANHDTPVYAAHRAYARAVERAHGITGDCK